MANADEAGDWRARSENNLRDLQDLRDSIEESVGSLDAPHFTLWNSCGAGGPLDGCSLTPGRYYAGGVPDTFTYHIDFRATVPVTVWIMSTRDFVCWDSDLSQWNAVGWEDRTQLTNGIFHDAEGCASYIAVFYAKQSGVLYPDISVTRNPAPMSTGTCA